MHPKSRFPVAALASGSLLSASGAVAGDDKAPMMDADKDGVISVSEHAAGARMMFEKLDADRDGSVTAAELDAAHAGMSTGDTAGPQMSSADKVRMIDSDGDGAISASEHDAGSRAMFTALDANGDGHLSAEELQAGHAGMMQKNPG